MSAELVAKAWGGRWIGTQFICSCPLQGHGKGRGDRNPSLTVRDGDNGDVIFWCQAGCDWQPIKRLARDLGLLPELQGTCSHMTTRRLRSERTCAQPEHKADPQALAIWRAAHLCGDREVVGRYIRQTRRISLEPPPTIRQGSTVRGRVPLPTMVAAVQAPDGKVVAVQETFLTWAATKAPLSVPRLTTGALGTGAVRLGPAEEALGIAEGVETALAAMELSGITCWASLGAQRLPRLWLPETVRTLYVFADNDEPGRKAATQAAERYEREGRRVLIRRPPTGCGDWNDVLKLEGVAA